MSSTEFFATISKIFTSF